LRFQATTRAEAEAWQRTLRVKLAELLGGFPSRRAPLDPTVLETREFTRYRREKVVFNSRPGVSVLAYVLTPRDAKPPARLPLGGCSLNRDAGVFQHAEDGAAQRL
jgi:plasmid stabilization system protein ParE